MDANGAPRGFFPPRAERDVHDDVIANFPFPLALTYKRLHEEMDRQEPVATAWQLRDAFECALKFAACLALADFFDANPDPDKAAELAALALKRGGLSLGDWSALLDGALKPLEDCARADNLADSGRRLPVLFPVFFTAMRGGVKKSPLNNRIIANDKSFVQWRNAVFGHGVFQEDRAEYARQTLDWLGPLHELYDALRPLLRDWSLISVTADGEEIPWQGADGLPPTKRHEHEPLGDPRAMFFVSRAVPASRLPLTPFLSVQRCSVCGQPATFFFDKFLPARSPTSPNGGRFLEYPRGHSGQRKGWAEIDQLSQRVPPGFEWKRESYDQIEVAEEQEIVFRDFASEYLRPDYLVDAFWRIVDDEPKGYVHLIGPAGIGKTYFVRGLEADAKEREVPVLAYHILPGALTRYQTFIPELADRAKDAPRFRTQEAQTKSSTLTELRAQFSAFAGELMRANGLDTLVIALDALDELPDPASDGAAITDFLPPPEQLPDRCFVLLTSRDALRPKIREDIDRLRVAAERTANAADAGKLPPVFKTIELSPGAPANQDLLRLYLQERLPAPFRDPEHVALALERSGGVFLNAFHFCRALAAGAFTDVSDLPDGSEFYPAYLTRLRDRVGGLLFDTVYVPTLLFLSAAQQPVTLDQLVRWGVPPDRLHAALLDLRDFLRVHRVRRWHDSLSDDGENRYEIAHEEFVRFVQGDPALSARLREAHAAIGHAAVRAHDGQ